MSKIFSNAYKRTENFSAQGAAITWSGGSGGGGNFPILLTDVQIQYQRQVNPMFPINADSSGNFKLLNLVGIPTGTLQCTGLLTNSASGLSSFLAACGEACTDDLVTISLKPFDESGCAADVTFTMKGVTLTNTGVTIQSNGGVAVINVPMTFQFTSMEM